MEPLISPSGLRDLGEIVADARWSNGGHGFAHLAGEHVEAQGDSPLISGSGTDPDF